MVAAVVGVGVAGGVAAWLVREWRAWGRRDDAVSAELLRR
jgi:hypothetical protein